MMVDRCVLTIWLGRWPALRCAVCAQVAALCCLEFHTPINMQPPSSMPHSQSRGSGGVAMQQCSQAAALMAPTFMAHGLKPASGVWSCGAGTRGKTVSPPEVTLVRYMSTWVAVVCVCVFGW